MRKNLRVGVLARAVTVANLEDNLVGTRGERLLLGRLEGKLPANSVVSNLLASLKLGSTNGETSSLLGGNKNGQKTGASGVIDLVGHGESDLSTLGNVAGVSLSVPDAGLSALNGGADLDKLADVDGVGVFVRDGGDESVNADVVTKKVADHSLNLVGELSKKGTTGSKNTGVQDNLKQPVDGLTHEVNTEFARTEANILGADINRLLLEYQSGIDGSKTDEQAQENN